MHPSIRPYICVFLDFSFVSHAGVDFLIRVARCDAFILYQTLQSLFYYFDLDINIKAI